MNKLALTGLAILFITVAVISCKHSNNLPEPTPTNNNGTGGNTGGNSGGNNGGGNNSDTALCFTRDILPIFISNCAKAGCHDAATRSDGYQFTDYNSIIAKDFVAGNADQTELYEKITEDRSDKIMPPPPASPLTQEQKMLIRRWINEGAQNTTNCGTGCDTTKYAYNADILPMINKYCVGCHSSSAAPKGIALDSYNGIVNAANTGQLLGAIRHETGYTAMPQGGSKLSDCEITIISKWINSGTPNN